LPTRILGIDPGLTRCGVGVIVVLSSKKVSLVHVGVLRSSPHADLTERIGVLAEELAELIESHKPDLMAIERVYADANVRSVMGTAQISGVAMYLAYQHKIPVEMHTPTEVKAAVTGNGRADKAQVTQMVTRILGLNEAPKPADAADALAIAICHAWRSFGAAQTQSADLTSAQRSWHAAIQASKQPAKH
jgi:crossover junction endodeoxyribonuclease RuvC